MPRFIFLLALLCSVPGTAAVIHTEQSLYQNILVYEREDVRCMAFKSPGARSSPDQGCTYISPLRKKNMYFNYSAGLMASLLLNADPKRILVIGLGVGTVPSALQETVPNAFIEVVEIDEAVSRVAEDYFDYREANNLKTYITDGRVFVKEALSKSIVYDIVILDAFNGDYIPEHLMTREFLEEVRGILKPGGVIAANTFSRSRLYDHESTTYQAVFGEFFNFKPDGKDANRIILATNGPLPANEHIQGNAHRWARHFLSTYLVNVNFLLVNMRRDADWNREAEVLTDEYSPANLLNDPDSSSGLAVREFLLLLNESLERFLWPTVILGAFALIGSMWVVTLLIGLVTSSRPNRKRATEG